MLMAGNFSGVFIGAVLIPHWRAMFFLCLLPALLIIIGFHFQPESPLWLLKAGYEEEARQALETVRSNPADP